MKKNYFTAIVLAALAALCLVSCHGKKEINIDKIREVKINQNYAVIITPYVVYTEDAKENSKSLGNGRRGDIQMICGKRITKNSENEKSIWYRLETGWVEENNIVICNNKLQAENYARGIRN